MTTPVLDVLVGEGVWLVLVLATGTCAALDTALARVRMRDVLETAKATDTAAWWMHHAPLVRVIVATAHALLLLATGAATIVCVASARPVVSARVCLVAAVAMALAALVVGELAPRVAGAWAARGLVVRLLGTLRMTAAVTRHGAGVLLWVARGAARLLGVPADAPSPFAGDEEQAGLAEPGTGTPIARHQQEMIRSIFEFGDTVAHEIMTPRTSMDAVPLTAPLDEAIRLAMARGRSRIPVYDRDTDHIAGVFHVRDALELWERPQGQPLPEIKALMRPPLFVPESKKVTDLLTELRRAKSQMAIVVDEYGGTAGLVTIEDLIEEIVGDIRDEYAAELPPNMRQVGEATFIVDGGLSIYDINDSLHTHLPVQDDFDTLGGYIMYTLGRLPGEGDTIEEHELTITVQKVADRRAEEVLLTCRGGVAQRLLV